MLRLFLHKDSHSFFLLLIALSGYLEGFLLNLGKDEVEKLFPKFSVRMTKRFNFVLEYLTLIITGSIPNNWIHTKQQAIRVFLSLSLCSSSPSLSHTLSIFVYLSSCFSSVLFCVVMFSLFWLERNIYGHDLWL